MKSMSRRFAAGVVAVGLVAASVMSAMPANAATAGTVTSDFVSYYDNEYSAMSPDKSVMAVSYNSAWEVYLINTASGTATKVIDPGSTINSPGGLVFSPDGSTLYVANYASGSGNVDVIDVATATVTDTLTSSDIGGPWTMAISPDGGTLYIGDYSRDTIVTYDLSTDVTTSDPSVSYPYVMFLSPDGSTVYNIDFYGVTDVYNTASGSVTDSWTNLSSSLPQIYGACANSDVSVIYVVDNATGSLISMSTSDGSVLLMSVADATTGAYTCAVSPNDSTILVADSDIGGTGGSDYVATTPGQVSEYRASDLGLVTSVAMDNVAFIQQIQFSENCSAWVTGYYGYGQTVNLDSASCGATPELPNTGENSDAIIVSGSLAFAALAIGAVVVILRRRQA